MPVPFAIAIRRAEGRRLGANPLVVASEGFPITAGLPQTFPLPTSRDVEYTALPPDNDGAQNLGSVSSPQCNQPTPRNTIVAGPQGQGRIAYLGLLYLAALEDYDNTDLRSGAPDRLLEQAVAWAGRGAVSNDRDDDGVQNEQDNCPNHANPNQEDGDEDGLGDL